jgi:hypothetical protein
MFPERSSASLDSSAWKSGYGSTAPREHYGRDPRAASRLSVFTAAAQALQIASYDSPESPSKLARIISATLLGSLYSNASLAIL